MKDHKICVLTGAGISAESGIKTFRESGGLWEDHNVMEVASPEGWNQNMEKVLKFYNQRRLQLKLVSPNPAHYALAELDEAYDVVVITQNIDDLHERAGSQRVIHLHGELMKARSTADPVLVYEWTEDIHPGDTCEAGSQLRPHVVWFGELVPMLEVAVNEIRNADTVIIVGTSMQVYPAAGLVDYAPPESEIYYIDPKPNISYELKLRRNLQILPKKASVGVPELVNGYLLKK